MTLLPPLAPRRVPDRGVPGFEDTLQGMGKLTLGIMQPYFFPYLGYFDLIARCDRWVVFDTAQYRRKSWMNRNRIQHPTTGWQYVSVPVRREGQETAIKDVVLLDADAARRRVQGQIAHYRRDAPHYQAVAALVDQAFLGSAPGTLAELNVRGLAAVCEYVGIAFDATVCSELDLKLPPVAHAGQWALGISAALGATEYLNPAGGQHLFDQREFAERGIALRFAEPPACRYGCGGRRFVADLSIIDVLMWNEPRAVRSFLYRREA